MKLSIVVPTLNEAEPLPALLSQLASPLPQGKEGGQEVIVVDGGSTDGTAEAAKKFPVKVIAAQRGRAAQMNAGAEAVSGDLLWFLHADTKLPDDWYGQMERALADPHVVGGGFRVEIDARGFGYRFLDAWGWIRSRHQRTFYGDQGIFVRSGIFKRLGGFSESNPLEDLDFSARMSRLGKVALLRGPLRTCARRWEREGFWPTALKHCRSVLSYQRKIALVLMAKAPIPGQVKTRLVPPLTESQAADLYQRLLIETVRKAECLRGVDRFVSVAPPDELPQMRRFVSNRWGLIPQAEGDLGMRLQKVFSHFFAQGFDGVIALGADHPRLPLAYLRQAVRLLQEGVDQAVLGPTEDGGYYLVALTRLHPELFQGIPWSTSQVLQATREKAEVLDLPAILLSSWFDVDRPEDLVRLKGIRYNKTGEQTHGKSQ